MGVCLASLFSHHFVILGYNTPKFIQARMKKIAASFGLASTLCFIPGNAVQAETIFYVGEGQDCPKYTKPRGDGYCKAFVSNKFTGAYLNGGCPPGSGPVGQGYCMYNYK